MCYIAPDNKFRCCCCCTFTLVQGILYLAVIQITQNVGSLVVAIASQPYNIDPADWSSVTIPNVSTEVVNIGFAAWCVHNLRFLRKGNTEAFYLFAFAKFLRFATCAIDILVAFFYYTLKGDPLFSIVYVLLNSFSTMYEFYYSYIAWSLVYHVARGEDLDHGGNDDNGGFRHLPEDDGHTPMVAFPASNKV